jgi:hypothetical protein
LTPTIIHKLVNTTPNPKATKNSRGELVGPLPPPPPPPEVWDGVAAEDDDDVDMTKNELSKGYEV